MAYFSARSFTIAAAHHDRAAVGCPKNKAPANFQFFNFLTFQLTALSLKPGPRADEPGPPSIDRLRDERPARTTCLRPTERICLVGRSAALNDPSRPSNNVGSIPSTSHTYSKENGLWIPASAWNHR